jgi:multidrug transporter EmrE-like cation transporter
VKPAYLALLSVLLTSVAQIALKLGTEAVRTRFDADREWWRFLLAAGLNWNVLAGFVLYGASAVVWLLVLAKAEVSYAYPFVSLGFVLTGIASVVLLGEPLSTARIIGTACICMGVVIVARS